MNNHIEKSLMAPNLNIFKMMTVETRLTKKNAIFVITVPLILNEMFTTYKVNSVPIISGNKFVKLTNMKPFIIADVD